MTAPVLGVLGGSGVYDLEALEAVRTEEVDTPYGPPSGPLRRGRLGGTELVFLARHGQGHRIPPHRVNYRANVCALKRAGVTHLVSVSAVGSMKESIRPGDVVVVDQYVDVTRSRPGTFFDEGLVAHVSLADPVCPLLAGAAGAAARRAGAPRVHDGGTYLCIEGPQFSTRAESHLYRSWGVSVIGMTAMPEARLAREAELPYATIAFATDYDAWHETEAPVTADAVLAVLHANAALARRIVAELAGALPDATSSPASGALRHAILTAPGAVEPAALARLSWLLGPPPPS